MVPDASKLAQQACPLYVYVPQQSRPGDSFPTADGVVSQIGTPASLCSTDSNNSSIPASPHKMTRLCQSPSKYSTLHLQTAAGGTPLSISDSSGCATAGSPCSSLPETPLCRSPESSLSRRALQGVSKSYSRLSIRQRLTLNLESSQADSCIADSGEVLVTIITPTNATCSSSKSLSAAVSDKTSSWVATVAAAGPQSAADMSSTPLRSRRSAIISTSMLQLTAREVQGTSSYNDDHEVYFRSIDSPRNRQQEQRASSRVWNVLSGDAADNEAAGQQQATEQDWSNAGHLQHTSEIHGGCSLVTQQHQMQQAEEDAAEAEPLVALLPPPKWLASKGNSMHPVQIQTATATATAADPSSSSTCAAAAAAAAPYKPRPPPGNSSPQKARPGLQLKHSLSAALLPSPNTPTAAAVAALAAAAAASAEDAQQQAAAVSPLPETDGASSSSSSYTLQQLVSKQRAYEQAAAAAAQASGVACLCQPIAIARHCPADLQADTWQPWDFVQTQKLYEGKIAVVVQGYHAASGRPLALKVYNRAKLDVMERFQLAREVCLHMRCCHPYIAALYAAYKDNRHIYLLMELAPHGNLYQMLMAMPVPQGQPHCLSERNAVVRVIRPLMSALNYIHEQGLIHRDIKLENVLMGDDGTIKLADFGLSIDTCHEPANTRLGTQGYFAPEVLTLPLKASPFEGKSPSEAAMRPSYNCQADVWSAGVVCYEVLTGRQPFAAESPAGILKAILERRLVYPSHLSRQAVSFLQAALTREPAARATSRQLLQHEFIRMFQHNITL